MFLGEMLEGIVLFSFLVERQDAMTFGDPVIENRIDTCGSFSRTGLTRDQDMRECSYNFV